MRKINKIIIHCSYTPPDMDIGAAEIRDWHVNERNWSDIGYHQVCRRNGLWEAGRPQERVGAHVRGHNVDSIGLCLVGGKKAGGKGGGRMECNFTPQQWSALEWMTRKLLIQYDISYTAVYGHNDFASKTCPTFDVKAWAKGLRFPEI